MSKTVDDTTSKEPKSLHGVYGKEMSASPLRSYLKRNLGKDGMVHFSQGNKDVGYLLEKMEGILWKIDEDKLPQSEKELHNKVFWEVINAIGCVDTKNKKKKWISPGKSA